MTVAVQDERVPSRFVASLLRLVPHAEHVEVLREAGEVVGAG